MADDANAGRSGQEATDLRFDILIVGAGSAGATLAARLSEDPSLQVGLLEAGPVYRPADAPAEMRTGHWSAILDLERFPQYQWTELTARRGPAQEPTPYWRGRGIGGSSSINGQVAIRPPLEDFDAWTEAGAVGWSPAEVLRSFIRLEDDLEFGAEPYHGTDGPIPISRAPLEAWGSLDLAFRAAAMSLDNPWTPDCNAPGATGVSTFAYNARDEVRVGTNEGYLDPVRSRSNLTVLGDVLVDRVLFEGAVATGVRARVAGRWNDLHAGEVVVSAARSIRRRSCSDRAWASPRISRRSPSRSSATARWGSACRSIRTCTSRSRWMRR